MPGQDPENQKLEALAKQLAELERQSTELEAALQRAGSVRRTLVLIVVAILVVYGYLYYTTGKSFTDKENLELLRKELQRSAQANSDQVMQQAQKLVEDSWPTVSNAMADQFQKDMTKIMNLLGTERETLAVNVQSRLESQVRAKYAKAIDKHRAVLVEQFPSIKDDRDLELMANHFKDSFDPLIKRNYGDKMKTEFTRMYKTWDDFPIDNSKRKREELTDELYHLLFALMQHKLAASNEDTPTEKAASKKSGS